jgi:hypothetical protein
MNQVISEYKKFIKSNLPIIDIPFQDINNLYKLFSSENKWTSCFSGSKIIFNYNGSSYVTIEIEFYSDNVLVIIPLTLDETDCNRQNRFSKLFDNRCLRESFYDDLDTYGCNYSAEQKRKCIYSNIIYKCTLFIKKHLEYLNSD